MALDFRDYARMYAPGGKELIIKGQTDLARGFKELTEGLTGKELKQYEEKRRRKKESLADTSQAQFQAYKQQVRWKHDMDNKWKLDEIYGTGGYDNPQNRLEGIKQVALNESIISPLNDLTNTNVGDWGDVEIPSQFQVLEGIKGNLSDRDKAAFMGQGWLNPMDWATTYQSNVDYFAPQLLQQIEDYRKNNNLSEDQMREFYSDKQNLVKLLTNYSGSMQGLKDNVGGIYPDILDPNVTYPKETWGQWWSKKSGLEIAKQAGSTAYVAGKGVQFGKEIAKGKGFIDAAKATVPFMKEPPKLTQKQIKESAKVLGKDRVIGKKIKGISKAEQTKLTQTQSKATKAYNQAKKLYKGKKVPFDKSPKGKGLLKAKEVAINANKMVKGNIKGPVAVITRFVKKHGVKGLFSQLKKKVGYSGALKLLGKAGVGTFLSGTGIGTAAGVALNAYTVYQIYDLISDVAE